MSKDDQAPDQSLRNLRDILARDIPKREQLPTYSTQRLQPTVIPPPPSSDYVSELPLFNIVSPEDDIEPDHADDIATRRKRTILAMACVGVLGASGLGYLALNRATLFATPAASVVAIPEITVDPSRQGKVLPPPVQSTEATDVSASDSSMGQVSTELVPPTTDGLSPARKISTIRILIENDLEVQKLK